MGRRGKRTNLGPGLWSDSSGLSATVRVGSLPQREKRFRPSGDLEADLRRMRRWQLHTKAEMLGELPTKPSTDSLVAAIPRFLATMPAQASARYDYEKLLAAWVSTPVGTMPRQAIRRSDVLRQRSIWEGEGFAASTINHRVRALRKLFDVLDADDDDAINPCDKIEKLDEPEPEERGGDYALLEGVLACVPDIGFGPRHGTRPPFNKGKIRLRVMAWTGLPPALIRKITKPALLVALETRELDVTPRRKGKGVAARKLPLLEEAVAALRDFDEADAYGDFSNSGPWASWQRAKRRYLQQLRDAGTDPSTIDDVARILTGPLRRVYDLRHSFAAMVYEASGGSREAVTNLLMHSNPKTADRYVKRAVAAVSRQAIAAVQAALIVNRPTVPAGASQPGPILSVSGRKRAIPSSPAQSEHSTKSRRSSKKTGS